MGFPDVSISEESAFYTTGSSLILGSGRSAGEGKGYPHYLSWIPLVTQLIKNPPTIWKKWAQSLGWEDPLEKEMATHSSILGWEIPWIEEPGRLKSIWSPESDTTL